MHAAAFTPLPSSAPPGPTPPPPYAYAPRMAMASPVAPAYSIAIPSSHHGAPSTISPPPSLLLPLRLKRPTTPAGLGLWYLFNIYNKQVLKAFHYPATVTLFQFAVGSLLVLFMWIFNLYKKDRKSAIPSILQLPTPWDVGSLAPFVGGVALASVTETSFNWAGFWSAMASNLTKQSRNVLSKKVMVKKEESMDNITLFSIKTLMSFVFMFPFTCYLEGVKFTPAYFKLAISYMILQRVSLVTHSVGNCVKRVVVIVSSVVFFKTPVSPINSIGTGIARAGVFVYSKVKLIKAKPETA